MSYQMSRSRRGIKSPQLDPNDPNNWSASTTYYTGADDALFGFTVSGAICPIVFIVGKGCLFSSSTSGQNITFLYAAANASTKFYCFDLMSDAFAGSTFLKTYDTSGRITFNSLQPPLNVVGAVQAPGLGPLDTAGRHSTTYAGGYNTNIHGYGVPPEGGALQWATTHSLVDINLSAGVEYAAFLPWSRSCRVNDLFPAAGGYESFRQYSGMEGAYGRTGGMSFLFCPAPTSPDAAPSNVGQRLPCSFENIPTDRYPVALLITTANLPFPFG